MPRLSGDGPVFRRIANDLMKRIEAGEFPPGSRLPRAEDLATYYGYARDTIRRAINVLERRGVVEVRHGYGTFVRHRVEPETVDLVSGDLVKSRLPTEHELSGWRIREVMPIFIVVHDDGTDTIHATDRVVLRCP